MNKSRIFSPLTWRSTGQGGWIKVGYTAYLIVTQGSLHRIKYAPLEMSTRLVPAPEKAQHPSSWAHTLRDPHHKPRADALPSRWSSSSGSSVGAVHGFPLSPPPTFFTFFFNGVTFYVEYFSISSR